MDISLVADILTGCADFKLENDNQAVSCRNNDLLIQLWFLIKKELIQTFKFKLEIIHINLESHYV